MRTIAQETAFQIALRKCSKEAGAGGEGQYMHMILVKGECMQSSTHFAEVSASVVKVSASHEEQLSPLKDFSASLDMKSYKNWAHKISC